MFAHDDYDAKKSYLFTNAARHLSVIKTRLVQVGDTHQLMTLVKDNWRMNMASVERVKGVGANLIKTENSSL